MRDSGFNPMDWVDILITDCKLTFMRNSVRFLVGIWIIVNDVSKRFPLKGGLN
jgi:hypothetical protein